MLGGMQAASRRLVVVIPAHNEAANLERLVPRVLAATAGLAGWRAELLVVDDGSTDDTPARLEALRAQGLPLGYLRFTRNFGHQAALEAGLQAADADAVITMDADLQHPPEDIPRMMAAHQAGADVVQMVRDRPAAGHKGLCSRAFYRVFAGLTRTEIVPDAADFRLLSRRVIKVLCGIPEREKFWRGLIPLLGFPQVCLPFVEGARAAGVPSYGWRASWRLARKAFFDFGTVPLRLVFWLGLALAAVSFVFGIGHIVVKLLAWRQVQPGFTDLITAIFFLCGCILAALGVVGRYLLMILDQLRGRPAFVIQARAAPPPSAP